ncbi:MAG TPA: S9 family peptidase [Ilumatobacteraceae bacterium]|nr:S9 family peptidase [Ilumatobacteraceae bacterium]
MQEPEAKQIEHHWDRPTGRVNDPWAWLRNRDDPDTIAYLEAENAYSEAWFGERQELVETIFGEIKSRIQETDITAPLKDGPWWYSSRTEEGRNYPIHCRGRSVAEAGNEVLLDENREAEGRDFFSLDAFDVSRDHRLLAWSADFDGGGEKYTLRVRDLTTGTDSPDIVHDVAWCGTAWSHDNSSLFYVTANEAMRPYRVWRHDLGTEQADDTLVFEELDERFYVYIELSRSGEWIIIDSRCKTSSEVLLIPSHEPVHEPLIVRPRADDLEYSVDHWGDRFVILTNLDAEDFRVMTAPLDEPAVWSELVAHQAGRRIVNMEPFNWHLVLHEWSDAQQRLRVLFGDGGERVFDLGSEPHEVEVDANPEWHTETFRYRYQSLTTPITIYEEHVRTGERTMLKQTPVPGVDLSKYLATREWASSHDGTRVPVDLVRHIDTPTDGTAPCLIYGYGSYEASEPPWFSPARLSLLDRGFVWALAHPRGGGELGRRWYLDGKLLHKRNTFLDMIAVTEHVVANNWASPRRVAIRGGSAGGLLVGACTTMRPELFAAVVAEVPFVDVVTTMYDQTLPLTITEWDEWGNPAEEPFASYMLSYSPYDQTTARDYPALLITTGLNDVRVSYHEPAKWIAKLRAIRTNDAPLIMRCEMGAGHAGPSGRYDLWREEARVLAFVVSVV